MTNSSLSDLFDPAFEILMPKRVTAPVVFNSPHSGSTYPDSFIAASKLDATTLRRSEDCFVDELFSGVVGLGAPLMRAHFSRAYLDLNREPYELDPDMFAEPLPEAANTRSLRVAGGLGTIPRVVAEAAEIYAAPLPVAEAHQRIGQLYKPYHRTLLRLLDSYRVRFGAALLIDCHSMPSFNRDRKQPRPDIILGDRFGLSCASDLVDLAEQSFTAMGYSVTRNRPYAGGFITQHYGLPARGFHALQVEINRALYMDEASLAQSANFRALQGDLKKFASQIVEAARMMLSVPRQAAE